MSHIVLRCTHRTVLRCRTLCCDVAHCATMSHILLRCSALCYDVAHCAGDVAHCAAMSQIVLRCSARTVLRAGALVRCLILPALKVGDRGLEPHSSLQVSNKKMFLFCSLVKIQYCGGLRDREVACSAADRQGSNFESCVWRTVSSHLSHQPYQEVLLAQLTYMCTKVA